MSLMTYLYLCSVIPNVGGLLGLITIILAIAAVGTLIVYSDDLDRDRCQGIAKRLKQACIVIPVLSIVCVLIPNEKTMYMMGGAYAVQKVTENPKVQALNDKVLDALNAKLDEVLDTKKKK